MAILGNETEDGNWKPKQTEHGELNMALIRDFRDLNGNVETTLTPAPSPRRGGITVRRFDTANGRCGFAKF